MHSDRVLLLEGVHNFRDYGGYAVAGGGRLKRGLLWRSGQHQDATEEDLRKIAALDLTTIFDLRGPFERSTHPCRRPAGFAGVVHFPEERSERLAPHVEAARKPLKRDAAATREAMRRNYGGIPFRPELVAMTARYLAFQADGKGASLVNCMAGKDRTGITVAALHLAVGVHRDDIIEDYLLTNSAGDVEARIASGIETITAMAGTVDEDVLRVLMGVEPEYLESAFRMMAERHGSTDGYLRDVLGADDALRGRLKESLVER